jgi:hypothetical protein
MMGAVVRFLRLPLPDQAATAEAFVRVVAVRARLTLWSRAKVSEWVRPMLHSATEASSAIPNPTDRDATLKRIRSAVQRASRRVPGATCLVQAIAAERMLRSRGVLSRIRIGVAKTDDKLGAHAWLTVDDQIVLGGADASARFVELRRT